MDPKKTHLAPKPSPMTYTTSHLKPPQFRHWWCYFKDQEEQRQRLAQFRYLLCYFKDQEEQKQQLGWMWTFKSHEEAEVKLVKEVCLISSNALFGTKRSFSSHILMALNLELGCAILILW